MLLKIVKDNDLDAHIHQKGWILMYLSYLINKEYIPVIISNGSENTEDLEEKYEALNYFLNKFEYCSKEKLQEKFEGKEHKLLEGFRDLL